jgi:hypothetical protein
MSKLYWVKLNKTRGAAHGIVDVGHHRGLSKQEVIDLISETGVRHIEVIRHDDKTPVNEHQLDKELLQIWKGVEAKKSQIKPLPL